MFLPPFQPALASRLGEQRALLEPLAGGELLRALADEHYVNGLLHHPPRNRRRIRVVPDVGDRPAAVRIGHHARVERHDAVRVRGAANADAIDGFVVLDCGSTSDDGVECAAAGL